MPSLWRAIIIFFQILRELTVTSMREWERLTPNLTLLLHIHTWDLVTLTSHMTPGRENVKLGPIWTFSLRSVLTFVASVLDINEWMMHLYSDLLCIVVHPKRFNGCVLSYFERTANVHSFTRCTLTTLHCSKVSFLQCCHMKRYNKIFTKM